MAKKKPKVIPVGDKAQKVPQKPVPVPLPECEWAFHKVPKDQLRYCATWELWRLRGIKNRPWLELSPKEREQFIVEVEGSSLQEIPTNACASVSAAVRRYPDLVEEGDSALKVVAFLVDFQEKPGTLRELFKLWLKNSPHHKKWRENSKPPTDRWKSILGDIVILRAKEAGMKAKDARRELLDLWDKWQYIEFTEGKLSEPHWRRAVRRAEALRKEVQVVTADPPYSLGDNALEVRFRWMSTFVQLPSEPESGAE